MVVAAVVAHMVEEVVDLVALEEAHVHLEEVHLIVHLVVQDSHKVLKQEVLL